MPALFILLIAIILALALLRMMANTSPAALSRLLKMGGGVGSLGAAAFLLMRGRIDIAAGLGGLGLWLLGMGAKPKWADAFKMPGAGGKAGVSRVRSAMIEMELEHATGAIDGSVLAGPFEGRRLADLGKRECAELYYACAAHDPDGARLLEAYFDRRFAGWRPAADDGANAGRSQGGSRRAGVMSEDEAYEILGLQKGASREDVARAHRTLMKKFHPDHGGSTDLAARVNEAKDVLMRRHH